VIRKELITLDEIILREKEAEALKEDDTSVWFILAPTIVAGIFVVLSIIYVATRHRNTRLARLFSGDVAVQRVFHERDGSQAQYELTNDEGQYLVGSLKSFEFRVNTRKYENVRPNGKTKARQVVAMPLQRKMTRGMTLRPTPSEDATVKTSDQATVGTKNQLNAHQLARKTILPERDLLDNDDDSNLNLDLSGYQSFSTPPEDSDSDGTDILGGINKDKELDDSSMNLKRSVGSNSTPSSASTPKVANDRAASSKSSSSSVLL